MSLRIVFFGTPDHGAPFLQYLLTKSRHTVVGVVLPSTIKFKGIGPRAWLHRARLRWEWWFPQTGTTQDIARRAGLPVWNRSLGDFSFVNFISHLEPDLFVVASFTRILKPEILSLPKLGAINFHPSLLPKYRGADPIFWVLRNGEKSTGVTIHWMDATVDTGSIIVQRSVQVHDEMNPCQLERNLSQAGGEILAEALDQIESGQAGCEVQDERKASYFPPASEEIRTICWDESADSIIRLVRASALLGGASAGLNNLKQKVIRAEITEPTKRTSPGEVLALNKNTATVACRDAAVCIYFQ